MSSPTPRSTCVLSRTRGDSGHCARGQPVFAAWESGTQPEAIRANLLVDSPHLLDGKSGAHLVPAQVQRRQPSRPGPRLALRLGRTAARLAVDENCSFLLHPPLPAAGVPIVMERERASNAHRSRRRPPEQRSAQRQVELLACCLPCLLKQLLVRAPLRVQRGLVARVRRPQRLDLTPQAVGLVEHLTGGQPPGGVTALLLETVTPPGPRAVHWGLWGTSGSAAAASPAVIRQLYARSSLTTPVPAGDQGKGVKGQGKAVKGASERQ